MFAEGAGKVVLWHDTFDTIGIQGGEGTLGGLQPPPPPAPRIFHLGKTTWFWASAEENIRARDLGPPNKTGLVFLC